MNAAELIDTLELMPLTGEGGWFRRTAIDRHSSAILYLLTTDSVRGIPGAFARRSALHRLPGREIWHFHAGAPVDLLQLDPSDGAASVHVLGTDLVAGHAPQVVVDGGRWQGASTHGPWSLLGTTMAPPYRDEDFRVADRDALIAVWPAHAARITDLT